MANERFNCVKEAFGKLNYREQLVVSEHLGFCYECFGINQKKKFIEMAPKLCLTPAALENEFAKAIYKMKKYLEGKL